MITRKVVPVSMPSSLAEELDLLVKEGEFASRNEALKFGARLVIMMSRRLHQRAHDYAYDEVREGILRGRRAHVS